MYSSAVICQAPMSIPKHIFPNKFQNKGNQRDYNYFDEICYFAYVYKFLLISMFCAIK